ncbi:MAG: phosphoenolpyruvate--protein phosphotransferase [Leifsonia sp.]|nr:phosphoenolpyruvate--protein phosphotransferase [Leifsonia sp.]|tara:strand:+ start:414952 stop:417366 length:2415 start_codon:yes stop_codon:yes gene_type:complete
MIGLVVVSHSLKLAETALELALAMVPNGAPRVVLAAGAGTDADGIPIIGTDAMKVATAIDELADTDGVLVLMDLGSAVLSAELALELRMSDVEVTLSAAPFVEGLLAAVVRAAGGASLAEVAAEARGALAPKSGQLGEAEAAPAAAPEAPSAAESDRITRRLTLRNPLGLHARPAALLATEAGRAENARLALLRTGATVAAASPTALIGLGSRGGDEIEISAAGPDAAAVLDRIQTLVDDGFGELNAPAPAAAPAPARAAGPLGVSAGRAVGHVVHVAAPISEPAPGEALAESARAAEATRLREAATAIASQLTVRSEAASGEAEQILQATALMATDPGLIDPAVAAIESAGTPAANALWASAGDLADMLAGLGGRTAERVADVRDVRDRIVAALLDLPVPGIPERDEPFILVARDLAPADTATLDPATCLALVTEEGGPTSHTAIIARSLGIPAVVAARGALDLPEGMLVLVDGETGEVSPNPDAEEVARVRETAAVPEFSGVGATADAHPVALLANVGGGADARAAAEGRAEGIGLFRSEFLFLDRAEAPSVEEQRTAYREVFAAFPGRKVVVRTLDAGADKPLPFVTAAGEENPALGVRGLRTSWRRPEILADQLRAIAEAAAEESAEVQVMAPMVATVEEAAAFVALCRDHGIERAGIMIETPAAALSAPELAEAVDFVSLGTNDLTQYTMAADRQLGELAELNDPWQPAVLRLIRTVGSAGEATGTPVGVCGEAAADPALAAVLVGLGVTSLSMSVRAIPRVAQKLGGLTRDDCRRLADAAAGASSPAAAREEARAVLG